MSVLPAPMSLVAAAGPLLNQHRVLWVSLGLGVLALVIALTPIWLAWLHRRRGKAGPVVPPGQPEPLYDSVFQVPYVTWFLVHFGIPALAILAIVLLGIDSVIDKGTVSALLGSLFGYVLGSSAHGGPSKSSDATPPGGSGRNPTP